MDRARALAMVADALGDRRLIWLGKRGEDAAPLSSLEQLSACFSIMAPLRSGDIESLAVETLTGTRDEGYSLDGALPGEGQTFLAALAGACSEGSVILAYRPYGFLWSPEAAGILPRFLGGAYEDYLRLEVKPAVEQSLSTECGVPCVPWTYLQRSEGRLAALDEAVGGGPIVLRAATSSGGEGLEVIEDGSQLASSPLARDEETLAWSPFLANYVPVNLAGCVFPDGVVTLHTPSLQLIGLPQCTPLRLGYCGNDWAAAKALEPRALEALERMGQAAGGWLGRRGFRGAFGLDAMVCGANVLFTEINPRFQGSSRISATIEEQAGLPDIFLDHLMAWLGLASYGRPPLSELARQQRATAQIICYNLDLGLVRLPERLAVPEGVSQGLLPFGGVTVGHNSAMFALSFETQVTDDGMSVYPEVAAIVTGALREVLPASPASA